MKKIIILGIICLFVGMGFQPAFANDMSIISSRDKPNTIIENHPPYTPRNYTPCGEVSENMVNLSWDGGDPDPEDSVYYDVCFGDSYPFNITTIGPYPANQTRIEFGPIELECFTHYFWYIRAFDEHNNSAEGLICILVRMCKNLPPRAPTIDGPVKVKLGVEYDWTFWSVDPQHDDISYFIEWGDGTSYDWADYYPSGAVLTFYHTYEEKKPEFIRAKVKDYPYGDESNWSYFYFRDKSSNLELNNAEDCDCQEIDSKNLVRVKLLLSRLKVSANILLLRYGHMPEVKEKCQELLNGINSFNPLSGPPVICAIAIGIYLEISSIFTSMWEFQEYILEKYPILGVIYAGLLYISLLPIMTIHYFIERFIIIYCS